MVLAGPVKHRQSACDLLVWGAGIVNVARRVRLVVLK